MASLDREVKAKIVPQACRQEPVRRRIGIEAVAPSAEKDTVQLELIAEIDPEQAPFEGIAFVGDPLPPGPDIPDEPFPAFRFPPIHP